MSKNLLDLKRDFNWKEAFNIARNCPYNVDDVVRIITSEDGYNDGDSWVGVFQMNDLKFLYISAWCDYTGWDCQADGQAFVSDSLERLCRDHIPEKDAFRLGLTHNGLLISNTASNTTGFTQTELVDTIVKMFQSYFAPAQQVQCCLLEDGTIEVVTNRGSSDERTFNIKVTSQ